MCFVCPTIFIGLDDGLIALFLSFWVGEDHFQADIGVRWQVSHQVSWCCREGAPQMWNQYIYMFIIIIIIMSFTFGIHVQAVSFTVIVCSHVMVANGDIECVTACDVVTQWLPVDSDQPRPGLSDLQPLWSPHRFCKEAGRCKSERHTWTFLFPVWRSFLKCNNVLGLFLVLFRIQRSYLQNLIHIHRPGLYPKRFITPDKLHLHLRHWLLLSTSINPLHLTTLHPPRSPISKATKVSAPPRAESDSFLLLLPPTNLKLLILLTES